MSRRAQAFPGLLGVLAACVFHPPPPLPEELAAEQGQGPGRGQVLASATQPAEAGGRAEAPLTFEKGDEPTIGMSAAEIAAYNQAQGDPVAGDFPLEEALGGLPAEGELWAEIVTRRGVLDCRLLVERVPATVANFVALARGLRPVLDRESGAWLPRPYYDATSFHRVIPGFMIQAGDPTGTGTGNPGYVIRDEIFPDLRHDRPGVLSMANKGASTGSAQFFVTLGPTSHLDGNHTIFGLCSEEALKIADDIALVPRGPDDRPLEPEPIETIRIVRRAQSSPRRPSIRSLRSVWVRRKARAWAADRSAAVG